jgi:hypothetical protein
MNGGRQDAIMMAILRTEWAARDQSA